MVQARVNELLGGAPNIQTISITSATQVIAIPDGSSWLELSNTTAGSITLGASNAIFSCSPSSRHRIVFLYNPYSASGQDVVLTTTANTTTAGYCDLGASNVTLGTTDVLCLRIRGDGSAVRVFSTDN